MSDNLSKYIRTASQESRELKLTTRWSGRGEESNLPPPSDVNYAKLARVRHDIWRATLAAALRNGTMRDDAITRNLNSPLPDSSDIADYLVLADPLGDLDRCRKLAIRWRAGERVVIPWWSPARTKAYCEKHGLEVPAAVLEAYRAAELAYQQRKQARRGYTLDTDLAPATVSVVQAS